MSHHYQELITLFEQTFFSQYQTKLVKGEAEPVYFPADQNCNYHQVVFAHGYYSSALHEIAHWCVAGQDRRLLEDYGYWYLPDGRDHVQQSQFQQVEVKPQALEWAFCVAANKSFNVSADNLNGCEADATGFRLSVYQQVKTYLQEGFPERAQQFIEVLANYYQVSVPLTSSQFELDPELYQDV